MKELFDLLGKVTVIVDAGCVLCGAMAQALAKIGVKATVLDLNEAAARTVVEEIKLNG